MKLLSCDYSRHFFNHHTLSIFIESVDLSDFVLNFPSLLNQGFTVLLFMRSISRCGGFLNFSYSMYKCIYKLIGADYI